MVTVLRHLLTTHMPKESRFFWFALTSELAKTYWRDRKIAPFKVNREMAKALGDRDEEQLVYYYRSFRRYLKPLLLDIGSIYKIDIKRSDTRALELYTLFRDILHKKEKKAHYNRVRTFPYLRSSLMVALLDRVYEERKIKHIEFAIELDIAVNTIKALERKFTRDCGRFPKNRRDFTTLSNRLTKVKLDKSIVDSKAE